MFKLVVFFLFVYSAWSLELDETPAGESAVEQELVQFEDDKESGIFTEEDEGLIEYEITEGSSEGKVCSHVLPLAPYVFTPAKHEGLPGGSLFPCSLPKLPYVPMFPHSLRMFSYCNFSKFCSPVPKNWLMFPCSLRYFANVPLFPKTPGRPSNMFS